MVTDSVTFQNGAKYRGVTVLGRQAVTDDKGTQITFVTKGLINLPRQSLPLPESKPSMLGAGRPVRLAGRTAAGSASQQTRFLKAFYLLETL